jgi:hypothetical protein
MGRRTLGACRGTKFPVLRLYALTELLISLSALAVPYEFAIGRELPRGLGSSSSFDCHVLSGTSVALSLMPWCACLSATIPFVMLAIRSSYQRESPHSFSYLYLANTLGATSGATLPPLLIELFGFHGTLRTGAALNMLLGACAFAVALRGPLAPPSVVSEA